MIIDIISYLFDMIILIIYFNSIFEKRNDKIPYPVFIFAFMMAEVYLYFSSSFINSNIAGKNLIWMNINSLMLIFAQSFFYISNMKHRIFVAISMQFFAYSSEVITETIMQIIPADISEIQ